MKALIGLALVTASFGANASFYDAKNHYECAYYLILAKGDQSRVEYHTKKAAIAVDYNKRMISRAVETASIMASLRIKRKVRATGKDKKVVAMDLYNWECIDD